MKCTTWSVEVLDRDTGRFVGNYRFKSISSLYEIGMLTAVELVPADFGLKYAAGELTFIK